MIDLQGKPERAVTGFSNSRWNAAFVPVVFQLQRRDFTVIGASIDGLGYAVIYTTGASGVTVNSYVYVNASPYVGTFRVRAASGTAVTIDTPYAGFCIGFMNSDKAKPGYTVELRILRLQGTTWVEHSVKRGSPAPDGIAKLDVSKRLRSLVAAVNTFDYVPVNKADANAGGKFAIQYREVWAGSIPAWSAFSITLIFYFVNAAKQIQEKYGAVMGEHTPFFHLTNNCDARFLNPEAELSVWPDYPFDLSFIYSEKIAPYNITRKQSNLDINKQLIGATTSVALDHSQHTAVNRLTLDTIPANADFLDVWLELDIVAGPRDTSYVAIDYVTTGYIATSVRGAEPATPPIE